MATNVLYTASAVAPSNTIWSDWNTAYTVTTSAITTNKIWVHWISADNTTSAPILRTMDPAEAARREAEYQQRLDREIRARREAKVLADEADKKALALLLAHLTDEQAKQYQTKQYFELITRDGKRRYRLQHKWAGNVRLVNDKGVEISQFCIHPGVEIPIADSLLAQKLMLEHDEEQFLKIANHTPLVRAA